MAGGKRFKFQGSQVQIVLGFSSESPGVDISNISQANPAVVTAAGHGLETGDIVKIVDVVGMEEVNDQAFVVEKLSSSTFALIDTDSSGYEQYTSGGQIEPAELSNFCELTAYNRQGGSAPEIPATSLCSDAAEFEIGLQDFGTTQLDFNYAPRTAVQGALADWAASGEKMGVKITLPNDGGIAVQLGFVQQQSEQAAVNGLWTASTTIRNTGKRVDIDPV